MSRLEGKVAFITGGARGQGAAESRLFAREGARVVIGDVLDAEGEVLAKELGAAAVYVHHDVTSEDDWAAAISLTTERFSGLDVLVNNAGIFRLVPIAMSSLDDYLQIIQVNQIGVFLGIRAAATAMRSGGSIINISSVAGLQGSAGAIAYTSSKFAVRGMTKSAAVELAPLGIRVNSIHPGFIDTPMIDELADLHGSEVLDLFRSRVPQSAFGSAEDVAALALHLASDDSRYSTGSEFVVDGGLTAVLGGAAPME